MMHCLCQILMTVGSFASIGLLVMESTDLPSLISSSYTNILITKSISSSKDLYLFSALCINRRVALNLVSSFSLTNSVNTNSETALQKIHAILYVHSRSATMIEMVTSSISVNPSWSRNSNRLWPTYNAHSRIKTMVDESRCICNFNQVRANEENTDKNEHASLGDGHYWLVMNKLLGRLQLLAWCDKWFEMWIFILVESGFFLLPVFFPIQFDCIFEICWNKQLQQKKNQE